MHGALGIRANHNQTSAGGTVTPIMAKISLDIVMPDFDGYCLIDRIRTEIDAKIPVLAFSSSLKKGGIKKCQEAGFNGFLPKPINRIKLFKMVVLYSASPEMANFSLNFLPYKDDILNTSVASLKLESSSGLS